MGRKVSFGLLGLVLALAGCASAATTTPVPTLTLIPPTATFTPPPTTPTATLISLPGPADLATPTAVGGPVLIPALAQPLFQRALEHLAEQLEIDTAAIRVERLERVVWSSLDLGCGEEPDTNITDVQIDGFRFVLAVEDETYEYHTDTREAVLLCEDAESEAGQAENLLLETDPVAADTVAVAQRRLAEQLDLPLIRIRVVDVMPVRWTDSSLGCPQPGQNYLPIVIDGYRIVLAAGEAEYIFHSDSTQVLACDADREQLPVAE